MRLAKYDARVMGKICRRNLVPLSFYFVMFFLMILSLLIIALIEEMEALQLAVNNVVEALNA